MFTGIFLCPWLRQEIDPGLISSNALSKSGRTGAARFHELQPALTYVCFPGNPVIVAMIVNESRSPLNVKSAGLGARMLREEDPTQALRQSGVLNESRELQATELRALYQARFVIHVLLVRPAPSVPVPAGYCLHLGQCTSVRLYLWYLFVARSLRTFIVC